MFHFGILILKSIKKENLYYFSLHENDYVKKNYSHLTNAQISDLLKSTWYRKWKYSPTLIFYEGPIKSNFVNVNNFGVRSNHKNTLIDYDDLNNSIWFLGGSTTFGYGLEDQYTIPSIVEKKISDKVINFGSGFYGSYQENILLKSLLKTHTPKLVIFLDGHNEHCEVTESYQNEMKMLFDKVQTTYYWSIRDILKPLDYISNQVIKLKKRIDGNPWKKQGGCILNKKPIKLSKILDINLKEREYICSSSKISCITFLQPFPRIHVPHQDLTRLSNDAAKSMEKLYFNIRETFIKNNSYLLESSFKDKKGHFYVDSSHYSRDATEIIATEIIKVLKEKSLIN